MNNYAMNQNNLNYNMQQKNTYNQMPNSRNSNLVMTGELALNQNANKNIYNQNTPPIQPSYNSNYGGNIPLSGYQQSSYSNDLAAQNQLKLLKSKLNQQPSSFSNISSANNFDNQYSDQQNTAYSQKSANYNTNTGRSDYQKQNDNYRRQFQPTIEPSSQQPPFKQISNNINYNNNNNQYSQNSFSNNNNNNTFSNQPNVYSQQQNKMQYPSQQQTMPQQQQQYINFNSNYNQNNQIQLQNQNSSSLKGSGSNGNYQNNLSNNGYNSYQQQPLMQSKDTNYPNQNQYAQNPLNNLNKNIQNNQYNQPAVKQPPQQQMSYQQKQPSIHQQDQFNQNKMQPSVNQPLNSYSNPSEQKPQQALPPRVRQGQSATREKQQQYNDNSESKWNSNSNQKPLNNNNSKNNHNHNQNQNNFNSNSKVMNDNEHDSKVAKASGIGQAPVQEYADIGPLIECPEGCGRSFVEPALEKHSNLCKKIFQSKRKEFNSQAYRVIDNEQQKYIRQAKIKEQKSSKAQTSNKGNGQSNKQKWKAQSEAFRAMMKKAKGAELNQEEQEAYEDMGKQGMVKCEFCGRNFNDQAAKRHIPFCQQQQKKNQNKPQINKQKKY